MQVEYFLLYLDLWTTGLRIKGFPPKKKVKVIFFQKIRKNCSEYEESVYWDSSSVQIQNQTCCFLRAGFLEPLQRNT